MTEASTIKEIDDATIEMGQRAHIEAAGTNSRDHGFHDDWPTSVMDDEQDMRRAIVEKLGLIHEEISEALGEIRSGRDPLEIYYSKTEKQRNADGQVIGEVTTIHPRQAYDADGTPLLKPEGFLVELADANIRISDLVFLVEGADEYIHADREKRQFNQSRPYKHGRKF